MEILGIDIGGTGIKGAPVNLKTGKLRTERYRLLTPQPATPKAVASTVNDIVRYFKWKGPIGCTFPAVVKKGTVLSAANVDSAWIGTDGQKLLSKATKCPVTLLNDADAAGIAEVTFGAGRGSKGTVVLVTLGTGIGTALFHDGKLIPNSELGHIEVRGKDAEQRASDRIRESKGWSWKKWGKNVDEYLKRIDYLLAPDLFIVGGGVSKKSEKFFPHIKIKTKIVPARLLNDAGIVGAAIAAAD